MKKSNLKFLVALLCALVLILSVFTGCSKDTQTTTKEDATTAKPANETSQDSSSEETEDAQEEETVDPIGPYSPEIDIEVVYGTNATMKYPTGDSIEDNIWIRAYKDMLGINVSYMWVVDSAQFTQKMNVTIASNDLPDIFPVTPAQFNQLVEADSIVDLTEIYDKYAAPITKEITGQNEALFNLGKKGDQLYGIPYTLAGSPYYMFSLLFLREDWRVNLGLPEPNTMEDFMTIAEAFVTQDPDGNGEDDTYALALTKSLAGEDMLPGIAGLQGFANGYHAYPRTWIKDSNGDVVYGSIQPEMKPLLLKLQEMYDNGWIDPEFVVKDDSKVSEGLANGQIGMEYGMAWNPIFPLQSTVENNPDAQWKAYQLPSIDDDPALNVTSVSASYIWVVRKDFEYPEAIIKMFNLYMEKAFGENQDLTMIQGDGVTTNDDGSKYEPFKNALLLFMEAYRNLDAQKAVSVAVKNGDPSSLRPDEIQTYETMMKYLETGNPADGWGLYTTFAEESSYAEVVELVDNGWYLFDEYHGIPTPTMTEKGSTLTKMEVEAFTKIILGADISEFDKFVEDWKSLGGDAITVEINEAAGE